MIKRRNRSRTPAPIKYKRKRKITPLKNATLKIGEVSKVSGVPIVTLRFYEVQKLISPVKEGELQKSAHRRYRNSIFQEIEFIKLSRSCGFSIPEIRSLLKLYKGFKLPAKLQMRALHRTIESIRNQQRELRKIEKILLWRMQHPLVPIEALSSREEP